MEREVNGKEDGRGKGRESKKKKNSYNYSSIQSYLNPFPSFQLSS